MNVYGRVRAKSLSETVERVAATLQSEEKCATYVQLREVGSETKNATPFTNKKLRLEKDGGAEGNRTPDLLNAIQALSQLSYSPTESLKINLEPTSVKRLGTSSLLVDQDAQVQVFGFVVVPLCR